MAKTALPSPSIIVKDAQTKENIQWEDCLLLLNTGPRQLQLGLFQQDTRYFIRLVYYLFDTPLDEEALKNTITQILAENGILASRCKKTLLTFNTPFYASIPSDLYQPEMQESYFSFLYPGKNSRDLLADDVAAWKTRMIYAINSSFLSYTKKEFSKLSVSLHETTLLRQLADMPTDTKHLCLSLYPDRVSVAVISDGKLLLVQSYKAIKPLDVVYHVLNVAQQLNLQKTGTRLFLAGFHPNADEIVNKLSSQFNQTEWLDRPGNCLYPSAMEMHPSHYFYHLVSLALCES